MPENLTTPSDAKLVTPAVQRVIEWHRQHAAESGAPTDAAPEHDGLESLDAGDANAGNGAGSGRQPA